MISYEYKQRMLISRDFISQQKPIQGRTYKLKFTIISIVIVQTYYWHYNNNNNNYNDYNHYFYYYSNALALNEFIYVMPMNSTIKALT